MTVAQQALWERTSARVLSLAWKILWLASDIWAHGKDLYDAVLPAERVTLPEDLRRWVLLKRSASGRRRSSTSTRSGTGRWTGKSSRSKIHRFGGRPSCGKDGRCRRWPQPSSDDEHAVFPLGLPRTATMAGR